MTEFRDVTPEISGRLVQLRRDILRAMRGTYAIEPALTGAVYATLEAFDEAVAKQFGEIIAVQVALLGREEEA